jgi:RHS repeat-associated protein
VVATYTYDPYGNLKTSSGTVNNPFLFSGQYRDSESWLYYLRARYYDPGRAQFLSRDPLADMTRQPYSYTSDNPMNTVDPSGLQAISACGNVTAGVGLGGGWSQCLVLLNFTHIVETKSCSVGLGKAGASVDASLGIDRASSLEELKGGGYTVGGDIHGVVGGGFDVNLSKEKNGARPTGVTGGSLSLGAGGGGGAHGYYTNTYEAVDLTQAVVDPVQWAARSLWQFVNPPPAY